MGKKNTERQIQDIYIISVGGFKSFFSFLTHSESGLFSFFVQLLQVITVSE